MVCSSFNIQYQRTGITPISSLGKIGSRSRHGIFPMTGTYFSFRISDTLSLWWSVVAPSKFNIKEQGFIGPLSSLGEIGPRGSVCMGCIIKQHVAFTVYCKRYFFKWTKIIELENRHHGGTFNNKVLNI